VSEATDDPVETRVVMSEKTAAALRERGGNLYVWTEGAGLPVARTVPPHEPIAFTTTSRDDWFVHVDSSIDGVPGWLIKWTRLPWPRFSAEYYDVPPDFGHARPTIVDLIAELLRP
jgi:hypothetical protein